MPAGFPQESSNDSEKSPDGGMAVMTRTPRPSLSAPLDDQEDRPDVLGIRTRLDVNLVQTSLLADEDIAPISATATVRRVCYCGSMTSAFSLVGLRIASYVRRTAQTDRTYSIQSYTIKTTKFLHALVPLRVPTAPH